VRVLLITHDASRTGAPRIALLVARSLVGQGHHVEVVSRARGPLLSEFEKVAPTSVELFVRLRGGLWRIPRLRPLAWLLDTALVVLTVVRRRPDLVYINSTAAAIYVRPARWLRCSALLHVHESGPLASDFLRSAGVPITLRRVTLVACSPSVQTALCELSGRPADGVAMVPSVPDDGEVIRKSTEPPDRGYSHDDLVVGCCGTVEHRKGADLWVDVAEKVRRALPDRPIRFVWVGDIVQPVSPEVQNLGVEFVGPSPNPYAHMRRFDVVTLPSRDDPFPLVVLEAMLVGTPVVAFAVGGVPTQVGEAGIVVTPGDTDAFARGVVRLLSDDKERDQLGTAAHARVADHYSTRAFAAALGDVVRTVHVTRN
jgi:glycosyltransferase involved in cell wall biosynthesis